MQKVQSANHRPATQRQSQTLDGMHASATRKLDALLRNPLTTTRMERAHDVLHPAIAALPLPTDEFGYLTNRLDNALGYCRRNLVGPARYELRLVLKRLVALG